MNATNEEVEIETENKQLIEKPKITLNEFIDENGYTVYHYIMILITGLSLASDGIEIFLIYLISPLLKRLYNLSNHQVSIITSSLFLGIAIGSILSSLTIQHFGRRNPLVINMFLIALFGTVCILFDDILWFTICRLIIGISIGFLFNLPNALCEILPKHNRDFLLGSIYIYIKIQYIFVQLFISFSYSDNSKSG